MEGRRRTRVADELGIDAYPKDIGPRLLILLEEVNATMKQLARYWEKIRESGDPKVSPAVDALNEISTWAASCACTSSWSRGPPPPAPSEARRSASSSPPASWPATASTLGGCSPPKSTKHHGRAQVVSGGSARETQILFFTEAEAREWATTGKKAAAVGGPVPVQLHKPPAEPLTDTRPTSTGELPPAPEPPASGDRPADARNLTPTPATAPGELAANATATPPATPAPAVVDDDQAVGLREAAEHHLPGITLAALRFARANDPTFPGSAGKRRAALLYRVGDLKKWARNRPRAATGTTDLD
ncbi:hypothetical protein [Streptomyces asiaticus]